MIATITFRKASGGEAFTKDFPLKKGEVKEVEEKLNFGEDEEENIEIVDYECEYSFTIANDFITIYTLDNIMTDFEDAIAENEEVFVALLDYFEFDLERTLYCYSKQYFGFISDVSSTEELGKYLYAEDLLPPEYYEIEENHLDFDAIGEDHVNNTYGYFVETGNGGYLTIDM